MEQLQDHVNTEVNRALKEKGFLDNCIEVVDQLDEVSDLEEVPFNTDLINAPKDNSPAPKIIVIDEPSYLPSAIQTATV